MPITRRAVVLGLPPATLLAAGRMPSPRRTTPSAAIGPFYPQNPPGESDGDLTRVAGGGRAAGQIVQVAGRVRDRRGRPVGRVQIEVWQANAAGRYAHPADGNPAPLDPNFQGFARLVADSDGFYRFVTIKPGAYPDGLGAPRPPHIHLAVRSGPTRLVTQMLFPGEPLNARDDVIASADQPALIATPLGRGVDGALRFAWDIVLDQG